MPVLSVLVPFVPHRPEHIVPYAAYLQWSPAHRLWQGQGTLIDPFQSFSYAAAAGFRVPVGTGVTLMPLRHPYEAALQARSLAAATGHPVVAGFGPGARTFQQSLLGSPYRSQLTAVREYVSVVRGLLEGEQGTVLDGEIFQVNGGLHPLPAPPVQIGLGVLRPGMARVAGELADVAITWLTPADYVRQTLRPALAEGAEAGRRTAPQVVSMVPMAIRGAKRDPVRLALASNTGHLRLPHYQDMLRRAGVDTDPSDLESGAKGLLESGAFLYGTVRELAEAIHRYWDSGVDEVVVNLSGVHTLYGSQTALTELDEIIREAAL
ncbi:LLM class flavin-dependent oxidoreductase [Streptomyces sp. NPDC048565]|uniref:LLM class flavin-dependent oxidoreductase n=1 Tax=Streptomyces sp. NPDC048565 TaxID=3155266 RepID=UPI0034223AD9